MSAVEFHRDTDPACRFHVEPQTPRERRRYDRMRGYGCPTCLPDTPAHKPLMTWSAPRVQRRAHVVLLIVVAAVLIVAGTIAVDALIVDHETAVFSAALWGWTVGCAALAYAHGVIFR